MPTRSLTVAGVARIKPPKQGQVDYFDAGYPGLALRVSYGGAKAWVYFYRLHGKLRRLSLGRYPALSLDEAREAWRAARLAVDKGESPALIRPTTADSFGAVAEEWLQRDQAHNRSVAEVRRVIERDVNPAWGERLIGAITRRDALELIDSVADRGALTMARRLHAHLHRLFRWSVGRGIVEVNPMADLPKPGAAVKRDRVLTDNELKAIWEATEKIGWPFGPAVRLLFLTGARRDEIGSLSWAEIHDNEIRLPGARSKSGEARIIPLSPPAVELLKGLPRVGDQVFTTNGRTAVSGWSKAKRLLDTAAAEINGEPLALWRIHDVRRSIATGLQRLGVGLQTIESVLGHVSGSRAGIVGVYQRHEFESEKRAALDAWAHEVERITAGEKAAAPDGPPGRIIYASATFVGAGGMTVDAQPIDMGWVEAVKRAEATGSPKPLIEYLDRPGAKLGPSECFWLRSLLDRMQFRRVKRGKFVPLGEKSRQEIYKIGAEHVRHLQKTEGLPHESALDRVAKIYPHWFEYDVGASLANFMKRGNKF
jgi:integrase